MDIDLFPLVLYSGIVIVLIVALTAVSHLLGQKRKDHATHEVYESGQLSVGSAQLKISVPFYLTAILFIIFDLEVVFLFAWAISIRETGWLGYAEVFIFISISGCRAWFISGVQARLTGVLSGNALTASIQSVRAVL